MLSYDLHDWWSVTNFNGWLFSVLQNIADNRPKVRYIVAVDDSKTKLHSIVKVMYLFWWSISFMCFEYLY